MSMIAMQIFGGIRVVLEPDQTRYNARVHPEHKLDEKVMGGGDGMSTPAVGSTVPRTAIVVISVPPHLGMGVRCASHKHPSWSQDQFPKTRKSTRR